MNYLARILGTTKVLWPFYVGIVISSIGTAIASLVSPFLIRDATDTIVDAIGAGDPDTVARAVTAIVWLAIGLLMLGSVPGGTASNVVAYLAKGDVALSVAMTSVSTLLSPIVTPIIMLLLAGQETPVDGGGIAWTLAQPGVTFALCGARNPAQALDNARAGMLRLGADDLSAIDTAVAAKLANMDG